MTPPDTDDQCADTAPMTPRVRVTGLGGFHAPAPAYACGPYRLASPLLTYGFGSPLRPTPRQIVEAVAIKNGLTRAEIMSKSRYRSIVYPRQEAMWQLRRQTRLSLPQIARHVGVKDHTTVLHGVRAHEKRMAGK